MKLSAVLKEATFTPKQALLEVQSALLEKFPSIDTSMSLTDAEGDSVLFYEPTPVFELKAVLADLPAAILHVQERENGHMATRVTCGDSTSSFIAGPDEHLMHHLTTMMLEKLSEEMSYQAIYPADGLPVALEGWVTKQIGLLIKYLDNGRLKSAKDVFVDYIRHVPSSQSEAEINALAKQLEDKHDATLVAERKVPGRMYFIFAKLS